jgi:cation diffusion facilitator family transporter
MSNLSYREKKIITASKVAIIGNAGLSVLKISVGIFAGSMAVIADGIDSGSDVLTSVITLITAHIVATPPDPKYPYGYKKADTIATKILAFIIFFAGAQLSISAFKTLINPVEKDIPDMISVYVIVLSIIGKQLLAVYLKKTGEKVQSAMLIANSRNMQSDVVISVSVLLGLVFTFILKLPILDTITAFLVSIWIMFVAFRIFMETNRELMDGVENTDIYKTIIDTVKKIDGAYNPHRIRVRKIANMCEVSLDIEVDGNVTLNEAHDIAANVEEELKKNIKDIYDVLVHVEPLGNKEPDEVYGVSEEQLKKEK